MLNILSRLNQVSKDAICCMVQLVDIGYSYTICMGQSVIDQYMHELWNCNNAQAPLLSLLVKAAGSEPGHQYGCFFFETEAKEDNKDLATYVDMKVYLNEWNIFAYS